MLLLCKCIVIILIECVAEFQDTLLNQLLIKTSISSFFFTSRRRLEVYHHQMEWEYMLRLGNTDIRDRKVSRKLSKSGEKCSLYLCCLFDMDLVEDSICKQVSQITAPNKWWQSGTPAAQIVMHPSFACGVPWWLPIVPCLAVGPASLLDHNLQLGSFPYLFRSSFLSSSTVWFTQWPAWVVLEKSSCAPSPGLCHSPMALPISTCHSADTWLHNCQAIFLM